MLNEKMEKNNKNTEGAILEAAGKLFKENGFKGTTTTMIASQAGVTHAMLHYYYRSKEQIFMKVLDGYVLKMHEEFRSLMKPGKGIFETAKDVTEGLFDFMGAHQGEIKLLLEIVENHPEMLEKYQGLVGDMMGSSFERHDERLKVAVSEGKVAPINMRELVMEIILSDYSVFSLLPVIRLAYGNDEEKIAGFLAEQKRKSVQRVLDYMTPRK